MRGNSGSEPTVRDSLFDQLDVVIYEMRTRPKRMVYINAAAERVIGYERSAWERPDFWDRVVHPEDRDRALRVRRRAIAALQEHEIEYRVLHRDGGTFWMRDRTHVRPTPGEEGVTLRGVIVDITALREREEQRRAALREHLDTRRHDALVALARGIAEEFETLVAGVHSCASLLDLTLPPDHPLRQTLEQTLRAADRSRRKIDGLWAFAGGDGGSCPVDLSTVVHELGPALRRKHGEPEAVRLRLSDDLPSIEVDPSRVQYLVEGLVENGLEAVAGTDGRVTVTTDAVEISEPARETGWLEATPPPPPGRYVRLAVADDGAGMSPQAQQALLADDPNGPRQTLTLSAGASLARDVGGAMRIRTHPSLGTRVEVLFPAAPEGFPRDRHALPG